MTEIILSKQIIILGGYANWHQKIKELLPSVQIIDVDVKNRDISKIQRADAVFIITAVFALSFFKKITKILSKCAIPLFYHLLNG